MDAADFAYLVREPWHVLA